jgi:protein-S-isoprenylcysteine O-methyltransferase Ste14
MKFFWQQRRIDRASLWGAVIMALFAALAGYRWQRSGSMFFALLLFRDALWAAFFLLRATPAKRGSTKDSAVAYLSTALPLLYLPAREATIPGLFLLANVLSVAGFLLATLAIIELGTQAGVAPAVRGERRSSGLYRYFRHPMYAGYIMAESGWILLNPYNAAIFGLSLLCYLVRIRAEERLFSAAGSASSGS